MKIARIAVLFALVRFRSASAEVECQAADYGGVCPSNGDDIAGMHMSLLQTGQHMRSGTEPDVVKDVHHVLVAKAAKGQEKAAKVAVKAQGKSLPGQQMSPGKEPEDLKEVQDVLEGAAAKAAKFAVKAQEKAQPQLKDKVVAARAKAGNLMEDATKASVAKPALKTTRSKDDTTDVVPSPVGGRIKQDMKIDSLPHNARHYDKFADPPPKIWPCEYPSMDCNKKKDDDSAASPLIATGFCSFALLAVSVM